MGTARRAKEYFSGTVSKAKEYFLGTESIDYVRKRTAFYREWDMDGRRLRQAEDFEVEVRQDVMFFKWYPNLFSAVGIGLAIYFREIEPLALTALSELLRAAMHRGMNRRLSYDREIESTTRGPYMNQADTSDKIDLLGDMNES